MNTPQTPAPLVEFVSLSGLGMDWHRLRQLKAMENLNNKEESELANLTLQFKESTK